MVLLHKSTRTSFLQNFVKFAPAASEEKMFENLPIRIIHLAAIVLFNLNFIYLLRAIKVISAKFGDNRSTTLEK